MEEGGRKEGGGGERGGRKGEGEKGRGEGGGARKKAAYIHRTLLKAKWYTLYKPHGKVAYIRNNRGLWGLTLRL